MRFGVGWERRTVALEPFSPRIESSIPEEGAATE